MANDGVNHLDDSVADNNNDDDDERAFELSLKVLRHMFDFLSYSTLFKSAAGVNRDWNAAAVSAANTQAARAAARVAAMPRGTQIPTMLGILDWNKLAVAFPIGRFLADGAYKQGQLLSFSTSIHAHTLISCYL